MHLLGSTNAYCLHIVPKKVPKTSTAEDSHVRAVDGDVYEPRSGGERSFNRTGAMFLSVFPRMTV